MALKLKTHSTVPFIYPFDSAIDESCQSEGWAKKYLANFHRDPDCKPVIKEGEEPTVFYLKGLSAQVYDRVRELFDQNRYIQGERLAVQYGLDSIDNFIDPKGVKMAVKKEEGDFGKCAQIELVDALGFFPSLRSTLGSAILLLTRSEP